MAKTKGKTGLFEFTGTLERSDNRLWGCHFRVPKTVAEQLIDETSRRVVCTLNGTETFQCAILFYKKGLPVISVNKQIRDSFKISFGDEVDVTLKKDESEYGLPLPQELAEVFRQDKAGKKVFHALTLGKQRTLLYIIGKAKGSDKKIHASLIILQHLKENGGKIDYKKLNAAFKSSKG